MRLRTASLLGPMAARELTIAGHRKSSYLLRTLFAIALGLTVLALYPKQSVMELKQASQFGAQLFTVVGWVQTVGVLIAAPVMFAPTIAGERRDGSLDLLRVSTLTPHEIVIGKWIGALIPLLMLLLGAIPVVAIIVLLGGVDPESLLLSQTFLIVLLLVSSAFCLAISSGSKEVGACFAKTLLLIALTTTILPLMAKGICKSLGFNSAAKGVYYATPWFLMSSTFDAEVRRSEPVAYTMLAAGLGFALLAIPGCLLWASWQVRGSALPRSRNNLVRRVLGTVRRWAMAPARWVKGELRNNPILLRKPGFGSGASYWRWLIGLGWACAFLCVPVAMLELYVVSLCVVHLSVVFASVNPIVTDKRNGILTQLLTTDVSAREYVDGTFVGTVRSAKWAYPLLALSSVNTPVFVLHHLLWLLNLQVFASAVSLTTRRLSVALTIVGGFVLWSFWIPALYIDREIIDELKLIPSETLIGLFAVCLLGTWICQRFRPGVFAVSAFAFALYSAGALPGMYLADSAGVFSHQWHSITLNFALPVNLAVSVSFVCSFFALRFWVIRNFDRLTGRVSPRRAMLPLRTLRHAWFGKSRLKPTPRSA